MQPFEYVVVLVSLILGLGIAQILIGVSNSISNYQTVKFSLPHSLLILIVFITQIQEWWVDYQYSKIIDVWTLAVVLCLVIYPIILFLLATVLFPPGSHQDEKIDLNKYYFERWPIFFIGGLLAVITSMWQNVFISKISLMDQLPQWIILFSYVIFLVFRIKNRIAHIVYLGLQLIFAFGYIATDTSRL